MKLQENTIYICSNKGIITSSPDEFTALDENLQVDYGEQGMDFKVFVIYFNDVILSHGEAQRYFKRGDE